MRAARGRQSNASIHCVYNSSEYFVLPVHRIYNEKRVRRRRKHYALAVARRSQKFRPAADPLPGGAGRPKLNQVEMAITFT